MDVLVIFGVTRKSTNTLNTLTNRRGVGVGTLGMSGVTRKSTLTKGVWMIQRCLKVPGIYKLR